MMKQEFKRFGCRLLIRILILIVFLVICYLCSFMFITPVFASETADNGDILVDTNELSLGIYTSNSSNSFWWGNATSNRPTLSYYNNQRVYIWNVNKALNSTPNVGFEVNISADFEDKNSVFFNVYGVNGGPTSFSTVQANFGICELTYVPYEAYTSSSTNNYINNSVYQVHCNHLTPTPNALKVKLVVNQSLSWNSSTFVIGRPFFYEDDLQTSNVITSQILDETKEMKEEQKKTNQKLDEDKAFKNDESITGANSKADDFFGDFDFEFKGGITGILTAPLNTIIAITGNSCSPITLNVPFVNQTWELPCMTQVYSNFGTFFNVYRIVTFGIIAYWIIVRTLKIIKDMVNPDDDKIEVLDL